MKDMYTGQSRKPKGAFQGLTASGGFIILSRKDNLQPGGIRPIAGDMINRNDILKGGVR
jgi:hypothetical protein